MTAPKKPRKQQSNTEPTVRFIVLDTEYELPATYAEQIADDILGQVYALRDEEEDDE